MKDISQISDLDDLWDYTVELNRREFPENTLSPIFGNGKIANPKFMFLLINPTIKNISSDISWSGPRYPFIGTKQFWRVLHRAGMFDDRLIRFINREKKWSVDFSNEILLFLRKRGFYLTNIVKTTSIDSALPSSKQIRLFLPILKKEIELVNPRYIITFGLIPFENITNKKIRLMDYYSCVQKTKKLFFYNLFFNSVSSKVIPCYFPVGRGNPEKAVNILRLVRELK